MSNCVCGHTSTRHRVNAGMCDEFGCPCPAFKSPNVMPSPPRAAATARPLVKPAAERSRFVAIAEEFEVESGVPIDTYSNDAVGSFDDVVTGDALQCMRCGCNAFTPAEGGYAVCRGCPSLPAYFVPAGFVFQTNRYRCSSCAAQTQVTIALREVNLYCAACNRLSIHAMQEAEVSNARSPNVQGSKRILTTDGILTRPGEFIREFLDQPAVKDNPPRKFSKVSFDLGNPQIPELTQAWEETVESLRVTLGFRPFRAFEMESRRENANNPDIRTEDIARRTGRTVKGIIESIAWCAVKKKPILWVRTATAEHDRWVAREALAFVREAVCTFPAQVSACPRKRWDEPIPENTLLYIDHHFIDAEARGGKP